MSLTQKLSSLDWGIIRDQLQQRGYSVLEKVCDDKLCLELLESYQNEGLFRKTITMSRHSFGRGEYKYFSYPLPQTVQTLREIFYPPLAEIANRWSSLTGSADRWPVDHREFLNHCQACGQSKPTPLMLKYGEGDYNRLHQDIYGDVFFPFQIIVLLNEPDVDFTGGELILVENYPRLQSRPHLPKLSKGAVVIVPTSWRPIEGSRGWRRAKMRHGVSEVLSGQRHTLGIIFHDA
ncbi:MAG: 2OG-Fe(II) oxygenase [Pseudohongiellaceae bacterium]